MIDNALIGKEANESSKLKLELIFARLKKLKLL
jgi:hypothetical protein